MKKNQTGKTAEAAETVETAETVEAATGQDQKQTPGVRVYCGPSVRAVARQFTVYSGELPEPLADFIKEHPAAAGLLVPMADFAVTRRNLETNGTAEAILYNKVKSEL